VPGNLITNPYLAPTAVVSDVATADPGPPRPRAIVVTLVIGWIFVVLLTYALARFTVNFVEYWSVLAHLRFAYLQIALRAAVLASAVLMVVALHRRWRVGRWLGSLFILSILAVFIGALTAFRVPKGNLYYALGGYLGGGLITCGPVAWWFYAFTLSRKARAWFKWARESHG